MYSVAGERRLWAAVVDLAIRDIESIHFSNRLARDEAIAWVGSYPRPDFCEVCSLAGLDPEAVHPRFMEFVSASNAKLKEREKKKDVHHEKVTGYRARSGAGIAASNGGYQSTQHL